mmetsp:Transcript_685/g.1242  ORF Transcript_685/g.1242 Transcript_685/m.1242 type:complete len:263 (+) Transcript_685:173-961(+)
MTKSTNLPGATTCSAMMILLIILGHHELSRSVDGFSIVPTLTKSSVSIDGSNSIQHERSVLHKCGRQFPSLSRCTTAPLQAGLFGGMFGGTEQKSNEKDAVLGTFDVPVANKNSESENFAYDSLSDYIQNEWSKLFVNGNIKLTTPVKVQLVTPSSDDDGVERSAGVRFLFQKVDTGYKSKKEEEEHEEGTRDASNYKKKQEEPRQGGVEIVVEKLKEPNRPLRVQARRCEVDDDTMIKEMSEETILRELQAAIDVWKKDGL